MVTAEAERAVGLSYGKAKQRCQRRGAVSMKAQSIRGGFGCLGGKKGVEQMSLQGPAGERLCAVCHSVGCN